MIFYVAITPGGEPTVYCDDTQDTVRVAELCRAAPPGAGVCGPIMYRVPWLVEQTIEEQGDWVGTKPGGRDSDGGLRGAGERRSRNKLRQLPRVG